jgi:hypothetical protein
MLKHSFF